MEEEEEEKYSTFEQKIELHVNTTNQYTHRKEQEKYTSEPHTDIKQEQDTILLTVAQNTHAQEILRLKCIEYTMNITNDHHEIIVNSRNEAINKNSTTCCTCLCCKYICCTYCQSCSNDKKHKNDITKLLNMNTHWINIDHDIYYHQKNKLIVSSDNFSKPQKYYMTLRHELEQNQQYCFDMSLLTLIYKEAEYFQSLNTNMHFSVDEFVVILIFLKFPSFRILLNNHLIAPKQHFLHFYQIFSTINSKLDLKVQTKTGYTVLNSQIWSKAPIIFCQDFKKMLDFSTMTNNKYQGNIFRTTVTGKFFSLSFIHSSLKDIFIIIVPEHINVTPPDTQNAREFRDLIELDKLIDADNVTGLKETIMKMKNLITTDLLSSLFTLYRGNDATATEIKSVADYLTKMQDVNMITEALFNIRTMNINMKELFGFIWLEFINIGIDKLSIIKLRRICQQTDPEQIAGKLLLEYDILSKLPKDLQNIDWNGHIQQYLAANFPKKQQSKIILTDNQMTKEEKIDMLLKVMQEYDELLNTEKLHVDENENENTAALQKLLASIQEDIYVSRLMDTFFDLQQDVEYLNMIRKRYRCTWDSKCKIWQSVVNTRQCGLRSRISNKSNSQSRSKMQLTLEENCMMEFLDLIHVRLLHKMEQFRQIIPNRAGIDSDIFEFEAEIPSELESKIEQVDTLFEDAITFNTELTSLQQYLKQNEYDSEAIFDDMFPDRDSQSNIYRFFVDTIQDKIDQYDTLKYNISSYTPKPISKGAQHLIDLDFGDHVTEWQVKPQFLNIKEEWMQNQFYAIKEDMYQSITIKSTVLSESQRNKAKYNLPVQNIMCIKMYTDTNELQANFRTAFRSSSDHERRAQFIHWATSLSVIFIKIEVLNEIYDYNEDICNVTLYHGLNRLFNTKGLVRQFHGVLSTTWE
eukprot:471971_1